MRFLRIIIIYLLSNDVRIAIFIKLSKNRNQRFCLKDIYPFTWAKTKEFNYDHVGRIEKSFWSTFSVH